MIDGTLERILADVTKTLLSEKNIWQKVINSYLVRMLQIYIYRKIDNNLIAFTQRMKELNFAHR